jgi:hypothetical protein
MALTTAYQINLKAVGIEDAEKALSTIKGVTDAIKKLTDATNKQVIGTAEYESYNRTLQETKVRKEEILAAQKRVKNEIVQGTKQASGSYLELNSILIKLKRQFKELSEAERNGAIGRDLQKRIGALDKELKDIDGKIGQFQRNVGNYKGAILDAFSQISPKGAALAGVFDGITSSGAGLGGVAGGVAAIAAGVQLLSAGIEKAVTINSKISDLRVDLKTALQTDTAGVDSIIENLKNKDVRTTLDKLIQFAEIGGKAGVKKNIEDYASSVDKLTTALGKELGDNPEQTVTEITKLINVFFKDKIDTTNGKEVGDLIERIGNGIQYLANQGVATGDYLSAFSQEMAGVKGILGDRIALDQVLGLGAGFEELGQSSEVASTAMSQALLGVAKNTEKFAKLAGVPLKDFKKLVETDTTQAVLKLAEGLVKGSSSLEDISKAFDQAGFDGKRVTQVIGALGANTEFFNQKMEFAKDGLKTNALLTEKYAEKNDTLAGSMAKAGNAINDAFVNSKVEKGLNGLIKLMQSLTVGVIENTDEVARAIPGLQLIIGLTDKIFAIRDKGLEIRANKANLINSLTTPRIETALNNLSPFGNAAGIGVLNTNKTPIKPVKTALIEDESKTSKNARAKTLKQSNKAQYDVNEELERILDERERIQSDFEKRTAQSRAQAIEDARTRELELLEAKYNDEQIVVSNRAKEFETKEIDRIDKLARQEGVKQSDILKLRQAVETAKQGIEAESNALLIANTDEYRRNKQAINEKYDKDELDKAKRQLKDNFEIVEKQLSEIELKAKENLAQKLASNQDNREISLLTADETQSKVIEYEFRIKDFDITENELKDKLEKLKQLYDSSIAANNVSLFATGTALFDQSDLDKLRDAMADTQKAITDNEKKESKERVKNSADEIKEKKKKDKDLRKAIFNEALSGARDISGAIFELQRDTSNNEKDLAIRNIDKQYAARLEAAKGNKQEEEALQKEIEAKKIEIEIAAIERNAEIAKKQALVNAALAIVQSLANTTLPFPFSLIAPAFIAGVTGIQIASINKNADAQIAALRGEDGLIIENPNINLGKVTTGKRHTEGGEFANIFGRLINIEQGEFTDFDENGNFITLNRKATSDNRAVLDRIGGTQFEGKAAMLEAMNVKAGGIRFFEQGGFLSNPNAPTSVPISNILVQQRNVTARLSSEDIELIANKVKEGTMQGAAIGSQSGTFLGNADANRYNERVNRAKDLAKL